MRKDAQFANGEFYHIYNRGIDKREIFSDKEDVKRFFQSMQEFSGVEPIGSIYENSFKKDKDSEDDEQLINFICYCLNPNHFHFLLEQKEDFGISELMHRLAGYAWYYNNKYKRSGSLFQGRFKAVHVDSNEYLLRLSVYINLNNQAHQLGARGAKLVKSSWQEYADERFDHSGEEAICKKDIILDQFGSREEYKTFAKDALSDILEQKKKQKELEELVLE